MNKICPKCSILKDLSNFSKDKSTKSGHKCWCKGCCKENSWFSKLSIEEKRLKMRTWQQTYLKKNINNKIKHNLRARLRSAMITHTKAGSAVSDLGCSIEFFKEHIASKFQKGMTWDNYGEWHLDHINPLSKLNLSDKTQLQIGCHYTNIQPLWASDNINKSDTLSGVA